MAFSKLDYLELTQSVFTHKDKHQEILNEAAARLKRQEIQLWQFKNLVATMDDRNALILPVQLKFQSSDEKTYFFKKLSSRVAPNLGYWMGTPEYSNGDFRCLVQDLSKMFIRHPEAEPIPQIEARIISSLGKLYFLSNDAAHQRIKDIAESALEWSDSFSSINDEVLPTLREDIKPHQKEINQSAHSDLNLNAEPSHIKVEQLVELDERNTVLESELLKNEPDFVSNQSLPNQNEINPGLFWSTVDYISENPGKIVVGILLTTLLIAGITAIALGSSGIGILGLSAMGTIIAGSVATTTGIALSGFSLFSQCKSGTSQNESKLMNSPSLLND